MELQDERPDHEIPLELVGFRGVRRRVTLYTPHGPMDLDVILDLYVSIGPERRGAHLSRHVEALDRAASRKPHSMEEYLEYIAMELLERHAYANKVTVSASLTYYVDIEYAGIKGREPVEAIITVERSRNGERWWQVSVTIAGLTVCPSAQATVASLIGSNGIAPSHVQRVLVTGRVKTRGVMVRIEDLARALARAPSAPAFTLLKRLQEARLVVEAHKRPVFAEDVARRALIEIARILTGRVPGDALVEAIVVSQESIHPHDVYSLARARLDQVLGLYGDLDIVETRVMAEDPAAEPLNEP